MKIEKIKQLRRETMLSLAICKAAVEEAGGDMVRAREIMCREAKRIAKKLEGKPMKEGGVFALANEARTRGVLIRLGTQTDFVANGEEFAKFGDALAQVALKHAPPSPGDLLQFKWEAYTLEQMLYNLIGAVGENIAILDYMLLEGPLVGCYQESKKGSVVVCAAEQSDASLLPFVDALAVQVSVASAGYGDMEKPDAIRKILTESFYQDESKSVASYLDGAPQVISFLDFSVSVVGA